MRRLKQDSPGNLFRQLWRSPWGEITVLCSTKGVREVQLRLGEGPAGWAGFEPPDQRRTSPGSHAEPGAAVASRALAQLGEYLAGRRRRFTLPLDLQGTPFQQEVWKALREIPYGETRSYHEIARAVGKPHAARAVGNANGSNPVPVIVPCHRVIAGDGSLGGYAGGLRMKSRLLRLEGSTRRRHGSAQPDERAFDDTAPGC